MRADRGKTTRVHSGLAVDEMIGWGIYVRKSASLSGEKDANT
jgi:hypothetical protein